MAALLADWKNFMKTQLNHHDGDLVFYETENSIWVILRWQKSDDERLCARNCHTVISAEFCLEQTKDHMNWSGALTARPRGGFQPDHERKVELDLEGNIPGKFQENPLCGLRGDGTMNKLQMDWLIPDTHSYRNISDGLIGPFVVLFAIFLF